MSKAIKIILAIIVIIMVIFLVGAGILVWVGRGLIGDMQEEGFISVVERFVGEDIDFDIDIDEGTFSFEDDDAEYVFQTEDPSREGEIVDDFQGIPLPEIKMVEMMRGREGNEYQAVYEFTEEASLEELENFFTDRLQEEGWTESSTTTTPEGSQVTFSKDDAFLEIMIAEEGLWLFYRETL